MEINFHIPEHRININDDFSLTNNQNNYIDCTSDIKWSQKRLKEKNSLLSDEEKNVI